MRFSLKSLKPSSSSAAAAYLRHFCGDVHPSPPPPPESTTTSFDHTLTLLKTTPHTSWSANPFLTSLLPSLTGPFILKLTRHLPDYQNALQFFDHLKSTVNFSDHLSLAFQAVFEHAVVEFPDDANKLQELFSHLPDYQTALHLFDHIKSTDNLSDHLPLAFQAVVEHAVVEFPEDTNKLLQLVSRSKEQGIHVSHNASLLLIKHFGQLDMLPEMMEVFDSVERKSRSTQMYNSVIAWLLKCGSVDDAFKLLDEMLDKETMIRPNLKTLHIVVYGALEIRESIGMRLSDDEICKLVDGFSRHGVPMKGDWFTQFITRLCDSGECDKAWDVVHRVMDSGCEMDTIHCNALLTGLALVCDFERMSLLMKEMKEKEIRPDVRTYRIMIKHLCEGRRVDQALEVLDKMKDGEFGVEPDIVIYNSLIDGLCNVGRQEVGLMVMEMMRTESSCSPDVNSYNSLISGFCKAGEIDRGRELFDKMNAEGVKKNVDTFNGLINGMCTHGRVSEAMEVFRLMGEKGLKGDLTTYTTLITAFCNANNIEKALTLFDEMQGKGCLPDAIVYYNLISGLSQAGRMEDALYFVSKMKESGFCLDLVRYNVLINGFCRKNKLDKASEIIEEMEETGVKPDRVTYNTLISLFCQKEDFAQAHRLMKKMVDNGLTPNVITYGALIHGYCLNDNLKAAMKLFRDLSSSSIIPPNTVIYNALIDALCKADDVEGAISLMDDMQDRMVKPNTTTYNALFKGLEQRHWLEKALEYMDQMTEQACSPDYVTMGILTEWLSAVGETEKLKMFVQRCNVSGIRITE